MKKEVILAELDRIEEKYVYDLDGATMLNELRDFINNQPEDNVICREELEKDLEDAAEDFGQGIQCSLESAYIAGGEHIIDKVCE